MKGRRKLDVGFVGFALTELVLVGFWEAKSNFWVGELLRVLLACWPNRSLAVLVAIAGQIGSEFVSLLLQPWLWFAPFSAEDFEDPDVAFAAAGFRNVGVMWVMSFLFLVFCCTLVYLMRRELARNQILRNSVTP